MRWRPLANAVITALTAENALNPREIGELREKIRTGDGVGAFRIAYHIMAGRGRPVGWNKIWNRSDLIGWYGQVRTVEPLRFAALEIEADPRGEEFRLRLNGIYRGETPSPSEQTLEEKEWADAFNLSFSSVHLNDATLRLLRRLNLNRRERPAIEHWRWSNGCGIAYLSNGDRIQIRRELVWTRAVEAGLHRVGAMSPGIKGFLASIEPESREAKVLSSDVERPLTRLIRKLELFGFAERLIDGVRFRTPPGNFPRIAVKLWRQPSSTGF